LAFQALQFLCELLDSINENRAFAVEMVGEKKLRRPLRQLDHGDLRPHRLDLEDDARAEDLLEVFRVGSNIDARGVDEIESFKNQNGKSVPRPFDLRISALEARAEDSFSAPGIDNSGAAIKVNLMVNYRGLPKTFFALADPKRIAILERLAIGEASSTELASPVGLSLPAFAKHLRVLEETGLVRSRKEGRTRKCRLAEEPLADAEAWIAQRRSVWEQRLGALDEHLKERSRS
jgi:DNA-binding transcriptional ArsR family regulator